MAALLAIFLMAVRPRLHSDSMKEERLEEERNAEEGVHHVDPKRC
jgi:hypothetical protein